MMIDKFTDWSLLDLRHKPQHVIRWLEKIRQGVPHSPQGTGFMMSIFWQWGDKLLPASFFLEFVSSIVHTILIDQMIMQCALIDQWLVVLYGVSQTKGHTQISRKLRSFSYKVLDNSSMILRGKVCSDLEIFLRGSQHGQIEFNFCFPNASIWFVKGVGLQSWNYKLKSHP